MKSFRSAAPLAPGAGGNAHGAPGQGTRGDGAPALRAPALRAPGHGTCGQGARPSRSPTTPARARATRTRAVGRTGSAVFAAALAASAGACAAEPGRGAEATPQELTESVSAASPGAASPGVQGPDAREEALAPPRTLAQNAGLALVARARLDDVPEGGDGEPAYRIELVGPADRAPVGLPFAATQALALGEGFAVRTVTGEVHAVRADGRAVLLARDVEGAMLALPGGGALAFVVRSGEHTREVRVHERGRTRIVARELEGAALLAASPDGRHLVLAAPSPATTAGGGGIPGLWVADLTPSATEIDTRARCLTNCALSAGSPLGADFLPVPAREALRFEGDALLAGPTRLPLGGAR